MVVEDNIRLQAELLKGRWLFDERFQCEFHWEIISKRIKVCVARLEILSNNLDASSEKLSWELKEIMHNTIMSSK